MMVLCLKAGSLAFTQSMDEMSVVASHCLPHTQLWVSNLSKVAMQWLEVDSNMQPSSYKAQNISLHHRIPFGYLAMLLSFGSRQFILTGCNINKSLCTGLFQINSWKD